jgi:NAD(P)-dependent dehydrogenase (short-subunit alcohol dehydrogenase family)
MLSKRICKMRIVRRLRPPKARQSGFLDELAKASPLGRGCEPREMAEWVLMARGPRNTYMTGENIIVSGGYIYA